jgi:hypothetical protein
VQRKMPYSLTWWSMIFPMGESEIFVDRWECSLTYLQASTPLD